MSAFAGRVKKLDAKFQAATVKELPMNELYISLKIRSGKASDAVWEALAEKVWSKMTDIERHAFKTESENRENKPKTVRDFYIFLVDYFLDNLTGQGDNETAFTEAGIQQKLSII